jgi:hypothetical protein
MASCREEYKTLPGIQERRVPCGPVGSGYDTSLSSVITGDQGKNL